MLQLIKPSTYRLVKETEKRVSSSDIYPKHIKEWWNSISYFKKARACLMSKKLTKEIVFKSFYSSHYESLRSHLGILLGKRGEDFADKLAAEKYNSIQETKWN